MLKTSWPLFKPIYLLLGIGVLCACQYQDAQSGRLSAIFENKTLVVVTRNAPTTYYELRDEPTGPEYDLTQAFAAYLGVKVRYVVKDTVSDVLQTLAEGQADIAAAGLTRTPERRQRFLFGPIYQEVEQQLVCRAGGKRPNSVAELTDMTLTVPADTSYAEYLQTLQSSQQGLQWQASATDTESLLEQVWQKKLDCTVADSNIVAINRRYFPELSVRFDLTKPQQVSWMLPQRAGVLQKAVAHWFEQFQHEGRLDEVMARYYGFIDEFDYVDASQFRKSIKTILPRFRDDFEQAASKYDLDWTLLAAQAYQESRWRVRAKSPTGVRGIMMLTLETARDLGISSRLDPSQSILGAARYYKSLYTRLPDTVSEPDRNWLTLAAYNVGMGHVNDARSLAQRMGKDPDRWSDLAEVLPLLSQKQYYKTLEHGYARGSEAVSYVQHIRDYHDILNQSVASLGN